MKKKKTVMGIVRIIIEIVVTIIVLLLIWSVGTTGFNYAKMITKSSNKSSIVESGELVTVSIPEGATTNKIAEVLHSQDLIDNEFMFRMKSKMGKYDGTYKHGTYQIAMGIEDEEIMKLLQQGAIDANMVKITIPEGYTTSQIGALIEEKGIITAEEFMNEVNHGEFRYDFLNDVPVRNKALEGYLFPDTYFISKDATAHEIIDKMLENFERVYHSAAYQKDVLESKYSLDEIITIASIIEAEIQVPEEREKAAGVIYNRLEAENPMPLQMCSTVLYALDKRRDVVTLEDLEFESPYNTYLNKGLPIGPICNPGEAAIKAAIYPEDNNFYFFVLKAEAQGEHVFTETYDEFLDAKAEYKQQF